MTVIYNLAPPPIKLPSSFPLFTLWRSKHGNQIIQVIFQEYCLAPSEQTVSQSQHSQSLILSISLSKYQQFYSFLHVRHYHLFQATILAQMEYIIALSLDYIIVQK